MLKVTTTLETDPAYIPSQPTTQPILGDHSVPHEPPANVQISDQFWPLDERNINIERIGGLIFSIVLLMGAAIGLMVLWANVGFGLVWYGVAVGAVLLTGLSFFSAYAWPSVQHRHASWRLDEEGLEIRRGVLWRHQITIPLGRVQHADVSQGPLQRPFEIGTLTIHTAGTQNASVELPGLAHTTAIELRDQIVRQRKDQHVV
jgi:membrane protein YdbS with pleckstrin-like domain